jgi:hypothetical protein
LIHNDDNGGDMVMWMLALIMFYDDYGDVVMVFVVTIVSSDGNIDGYGSLMIRFVYGYYGKGYGLRWWYGYGYGLR